jgi:hypothetical protein
MRCKSLCLIFSFITFGTVFSCFSFAGSTASGPQSQTKRELSALSVAELVVMLHNEYRIAETASKESNTNHCYDIVVEELLLRRDVDSIPLLLLRANDETSIAPTDDSKAWLWPAKYDTPPKVKYKVRYILYHMLDYADYNQMLGTIPDVEIQIIKAIEYLNQNKETIKARLQKLHTPEEVFKEKEKELKNN